MIAIYVLLFLLTTIVAGVSGLRLFQPAPSKPAAKAPSNVCSCGCGKVECECNGTCLKADTRSLPPQEKLEPIPALRMPYADEEELVVIKREFAFPRTINAHVPIYSWSLWQTFDPPTADQSREQIRRIEQALLKARVAKAPDGPPAKAPVNKPLNFDLSGIWRVTLTNPKGSERWEATWNLKGKSLEVTRGANGKITAVIGGEWEEQNSKGKVYFKVLHGNTQLLRWCRGHDTMFLDIEEVPGFGGLILNGTGGKQYLAVRIEGGEGENKP